MTETHTHTHTSRRLAALVAAIGHSHGGPFGIVSTSAAPIVSFVILAPSSGPPVAA